MGFFDKLFGGKGAAETKFKGEKKTVMMPLAGKVIPLEELPDETFASAILAAAAASNPPGIPFTHRLTAPSRRCPKACTRWA